MMGHYIVYELLQDGEYDKVAVMLQQREPGMQNGDLPDLLQALRAERQEIWDDWDAMVEASSFNEAMRTIGLICEMIGIIEERMTYG